MWSDGFVQQFQLSGNVRHSSWDRRALRGAGGLWTLTSFSTWHLAFCRSCCYCFLFESAKSTPVSSQFLQTNCLNKTRGCDYSWADNKNQNQKSSAMSVPTFLSCLKTPTNRTPRKNASWVTWLLHSPVKPWANWLARSYFPLWTIFLQVYHLTFTAICHLPTFLRQL